MRELITVCKESNNRDRGAIEYDDERLGTHQVLGRAHWAFSLQSEWKRKGRGPTL